MCIYFNSELTYILQNIIFSIWNYSVQHIQQQRNKEKTEYENRLEKEYGNFCLSEKPYVFGGGYTF